MEIVNLIVLVLVTACFIVVLAGFSGLLEGLMQRWYRRKGHHGRMQR